MADEENLEYGLDGLCNLPLMEQVHRLFHAISMNYPYKKTNAWKSINIEKKKAILKYIQELKKQKDETEGAMKEVTATLPEPLTNKLEDKTRKLKDDPYLLLMQKKNQRMKLSNNGKILDSKPYSGYQMPFPVAVKPVKKDTRQWEILDEVYSTKCKCGKPHNIAKELPGVKQEIKLMMTTFGDCEYPCFDAVDEVYRIVGEYMKRCLVFCVHDDHNAISISLQSLVENFPEESAYYARWKEFRSGSNAGLNGEIDEEDVLIEELALVSASTNTDPKLMSSRFQERMRFADERTKGMDESKYFRFSSNRKACFGRKKIEDFCKWIGLPKCSKSAVELVSFLTYDCVGKVVETAIKRINDGNLRNLQEPLLKDDYSFIENEIHLPHHLQEVEDRHKNASIASSGSSEYADSVLGELHVVKDENEQVTQKETLEVKEAARPFKRLKRLKKQQS